MDNLQILTLTLLLAPLVGAALWFIVGRSPAGKKVVSIGSPLMVFISFACMLMMWKHYGESHTPMLVNLADWIRLGPTISIPFSFLFDPLSLSLGLVVTGVGALIHVYATGYMKEDPGFGRFFSYLNLFIFSMLMLTLSETLPGLFLGWEGVGLCSYLLISFWFQDEANAQAGKKAFVVNRVGDFGFLLAMFCLFKLFGSLQIHEILDGISKGAFSADQIFWTKLACFGLVLGATGKSAQIPLYVWLPDAMAGPTPVSALIHAATMVTAGVYLSCRLQGLFLLNPDVLELLGYIGGATAFFAATIAIFQNDIKRVLAYSTISQLGYMFLAVGLAAPVAAYFHLITHAFFKALLFLGAGSVIHGMHHEQDMRHMGGLRKQMPITFWTMTIGVLAIAGVPPLSGFVSKDEILHSVAHSHRWWLMLFGFGTALMTAFYMGRLWIMTFFGKFRGHHEAHESPVSMTAVLVILAALSALGGFLNWPEIWGGSGSLHHYLSAVISQSPMEMTDEAFSGSVKLAAFSVFLGLLGLTLAWLKYRNFTGEDFKSPSFNLFRNKYYIDELYDSAVVKSLRGLGQGLWKGVDTRILDGGLDGLATLSNKMAARLRRLQTGLTQQYAFGVLVGFLLLLVVAWTVR